ncbi:uncharacterized protein cd34 [Festucalex cinctus]
MEEAQLGHIHNISWAHRLDYDERKLGRLNRGETAQLNRGVDRAHTWRKRERERARGGHIKSDSARQTLSCSAAPLAANAHHPAPSLAQRALPTMWRMNGVAIVLVLCTSLLCNGVVGQDDVTTDTPAIDPDAGNGDVTLAVVDSDAQPGTTVAPDSGVPPVADGDSDAPAENAPPPENNSPSADNQEGGASGTTAGPGALADDGAVVVESSDFSDIGIAKPVVQCVGKDEIDESRAVKAAVTYIDCEETKKILEESNIQCQIENCHIKVYQEGNNVQMVRNDAQPNTLVEALKGELKDKLGVTNVQAPPSSSSSSSSGRSVFVGILVTGLLVAAAIVAGYCRCQRRTEKKGVKLAEEAYPAEQENQGNTLVSVAPLNPPTENQEKPNANGESPEAAKTEPPPTNGHSAAKTADTEL